MSNPVVVECSVFTGVVKWYNGEKGFGFLQVQDNPMDVFVHANQLKRAGIECGLNEGERVSFQLNIGVKGQFATGIKRV